MKRVVRVTLDFRLTKDLARFPLEAGPWLGYVDLVMRIFANIAGRLSSTIFTIQKGQKDGYY
jgi:hypothetical protein